MALQVENLRTYYQQLGREVRAVDGISFTLQPGRVLCLVGESGCGKSVTALSLLRLIDPPGRIVDGKILLDGRDILQLPPAKMEQLRGREMAMIFQNTRYGLHPALTVGVQLVETLLSHRQLSESEAKNLALDTLARVRLPRPEQLFEQYPFELSGGMNQRVMLALALLLQPRYLIADEPTSALDITTQTHILDEMRLAQEKTGAGMLFITHDLAVVAEIAHEVAVMSAGKIVESGLVSDIFKRPVHSYTRELIASAGWQGRACREVCS